MDGFLKVLGITEKEFENILLNNEVIEWGVSMINCREEKHFRIWNSGMILCKGKG